MPIATDEVRRIARLANLELEPATVESFRRQLESILDYVAMLDELDASPAPPEAGGAETGRPLRPDDERPCLPNEQALRNAPDSAAGHFRVPRVLGG